MAVFGDTASSSQFPGAGDRCLISKFTCPTPGTLTSMSVTVGTSTTAGANCKLVLLADVAGVPGATLYVSAPGAMPAGGGLLNLAAAGALLATDYWLGIVSDSFQGYYGQNAFTGQSMEMANGSYSYATPPVWPGTDATYNDFHISVSATYTESGGGAAVSHRNGIAIAGLSHINGFVKAGISEINGETI